jgi:hypothetical protein
VAPNSTTENNPKRTPENALALSVSFWEKPSMGKVAKKLRR